MPAETPATTSTATIPSTSPSSENRPTSAHRQSEDETSGRSLSPSDTVVVGPAPSTGHFTHRKTSKHVVSGHGRLGTRTLSSGRNLNKINLSAAAALQDVSSAPQTARLTPGLNGSPLQSPRHRPNPKRASTSSVLGARSASGTNLQKNLSGSRLAHKVGGSAKHLAPKHAANRSDFHRSQSHPNKLKDVGPPLSSDDATVDPRLAAVQFDLGDEDPETGEMEGVDDGWTDAGSPGTTRDNTRSNTRSNSMNLDPRDRPNLEHSRDGLPPDRLSAMAIAVGTSISGPRNNAGLTPSTSASPQKSTANGSFQEAVAAGLQPPNADAIARRLLQRGQRPISAPKVSEISAIANGAPPHLEDVSSTVGSSGSGGVGGSGSGSGSGPRISRFLADQAGGTPTSGSGRLAGGTSESQNESAAQTPPEDDSERLSDDKRNRSTPNLGVQFSPLPQEMASASGTHTPPAVSRPSRTQQKLWLQRGLSNMEASNQQHASALGNFQGGGMPALMRQLDKVEKEYKVIRRFHDPIHDSVDRLKRHSVRLEGIGVFYAGTGATASKTGTLTPSKPNKAYGSRTPPADSHRTSLNNPPISSSQGSGGPASGSGGTSGGSRSSPASLALPPRIDENEATVDETEATNIVVKLPPPDWANMSLDELEIATLDTRQRMWDLVRPIENVV